MHFGRAAFAAALFTGGTLLAYAAPLAAQDTAAEEVTEEVAEGGEIVVTARRREERLVDVPIAVTAISGEELTRRGALDITDVSQSVPNVTLEPSRGTNSTLTAFIRGIGQQDPVSGFEQGVGIYLDDVYLNRPQGAVLDIYDVERIEVLRGPQGTLYGRNTIGGAVKYVTRRLSRDFDLRVRATYGTYDQAEGVVTMSAPVHEQVRIGGSVARLSRGGFGTNLTTGLENYNKDIWAGRASLELGGYGEPVFVRIAGDYTRDKSNPRGGHRLIPSLFSNAPVLDDVFDTRGGLLDPQQDVESYGLSMHAEIALSEALTLRSISAWRKDDSASPIDFDALATVDLDVPAFYRNEQISQELQLLWDNDGAFSGLVGAYYLDAKADTLFDVRLFTTFAGFTAFTEAAVDTRAFAVFADATVDLTDQLSLGLGGRYTWDERSAYILRQNYLGGGSPVFGGAGIPFLAPATNFRGSEDFEKFTPRVSLSFKPTPDHNIYASYSKGFKGGGFNPRGVSAVAPDLDGNGVVDDAERVDYLSFDPEVVDSYEVGYKGNLADGAVYVALAGFFTDYTDVQVIGSEGCVVNGSATFCGLVENAGKAEIKGIELETSIRLGRDIAASGDRLSLTGAVGWIDAKYKEFLVSIPGRGPVDTAEFVRIQNTPEWTANATLAYTAPVGEGSLYLGTALTYRSKTIQFEVPNPFYDQPAYALWDASVVYTAPNDRWSIGLYGKNLTDQEYKTAGYNFIRVDPVTGALQFDAQGRPISGLGREGTLTAFYGNPRQVFLTATFKY